MPRGAKQAAQGPVEELGPLYCFIKHPPASFCRDYERVVGLLSACPDGAEIVLSPSDYPKPKWRERWQRLARALGPGGEATRRRALVVSKVVSLTPPQCWSPDNLRFLGLQRRIWWVRKANRWFERPCSTHSNYVEIGTAALVLELFYRFVWARHTWLCVRRSYDTEGGQQDSTAAPAEDDASCTSDREAAVDDEGDQGDAVIDACDLGELDDDDDDDAEDEEDDDEDIADADAEICLDDDDGHASPELGASAAASTKRPRIDAVEAVLRHEGDTRDVDDDANSSSSQMSSDDDDDGQPPETPPPRARPAAAAADCGIALESAQEVPPGWLAAGPDDAPPPRTSLFFAHGAITSAIDAVEGEYLERCAAGDAQPAFSVRPALEAFAALAALRSRSHDAHARTTRAEALDDVVRRLRKRLARFLGRLGLEVSGDDLCEWRWPESSAALVDGAYTRCFANLTAGGTRADGVAMARLFPRLAGLQDSRVDARLPEVCRAVQAQLDCRGKRDARTDRVVAALDALADERRAIARSDEADEGDGEGCEGLGAVAQARKRRLREIDEQTERLRDEFHALTAAADAVEPTRKRRRKTATVDTVAESLGSSSLADRRD
eukprot:m51a1_g12441 hypothetical protein (610) ;mRNA; r:843287-845548